MEHKWEVTMVKIMEEITSQEYKKMLVYLKKIPTDVKKRTSKIEMPQKINRYYGYPESVQVMAQIMGEIPRNDDAIQSLLRPFLTKRIGGEKNKEKKKKTSAPRTRDTKQLSKKKTSASPPVIVKQISIKNAKDCEPDTIVTIKGKVTYDSGVEKVKSKKEKKKIERRTLILKDKTDTIEVCLWRGQVEKNVAVGDSVICKAKVNKFKDRISLTAGWGSTVEKVIAAPRMTITLTIKEMIKFTKKEVTLKAETSKGDQIFTVTATRVVNFFKVKLDEGFKENLLKMFPAHVEVVVQGNKIVNLKKA